MGPSPTSTIARTHARIGLIGNPSDGYGGAAIAFPFDAFAAEFSLAPSLDSPGGFSIVWQGERVFSAHSLSTALEPTASEAAHGAARLVLAAGRMLARNAPDGALGNSEFGAFVFTGHTSIPLQAGLAGSSAIVISVLRLLADRYALELADDELASLALRAETEELGIAAGAMDRIAQTRGGLLLMDFGGDAATVDPIAAPLPDGLYVAWHREAGAPSGRVHGRLRERFEAREARVLSAMQRFRALAYEGRAALEAGDACALARLLDENFDLRREVVGVSERDEELVSLGRSEGAGVKLTGSGGAVVGLATPDALPALERCYTQAGHGFLLPQLAAPSDPRVVKGSTSS